MALLASPLHRHRQRLTPLLLPMLVPVLAMLPFAAVSGVLVRLDDLSPVAPSMRQLADSNENESEETMTATLTRPSYGVIRPSATYHGKQGFDYFAGISAESVGATGICMHLLEIPPGARAKAHLHENHETAIYVLSGRAETWIGEALEQRLVVEAGDLLYIPAGMPHLPINPSATDPCVAVLARTDPNEQESVVLLPELERAVPQ